MVPTQFRRLLALPEPVRSRYDTGSLRAAIHGAAPCPREVKQRMLDWWGPVVIEYPHDEWGEEIKAVVQPAPGTAPTAELLEFLRGRIAAFKLPRTIDYVEELPRDPNGKLYKRRLRDPYWAGHDPTI